MKTARAYADKAIVILLSVYIFLSLGILFLGAYYCQPNTEEFLLCQQSRDLGWKEAAIHMMVHFDGRYFVNVLHAFNPLTYNSIFGYKLMPAISIALFITAVYFFTSLFVTAGRRYLLLAIVAFTCLFFQISVGIITQLYWMAAAFVYQWSWTFVFLWAGAYIIMVRSENIMKKWCWFMLTILLLFAAFGLCEMFLILNLFLLTAITAWSVFNRKDLLPTILLLIFGLACVWLFVTSPGIAWRATQFKVQGEPLIGIRAFKNALYGNVQVIADVFFHLQMTECCIAVYPLLSRIKLKSELAAQLKFRYFYLTAGVLIGVAYLMTLAYYIPTQNNEGLPVRIFASVQLLLIAAAFLCYYPIITLISKKIKSSLAKTAYVVASVILVAGIFFQSSKTNTLNAIFRDYQNETLQNFDALFQQRYEQLHATAQQKNCYKEVTFSPVINYPYSVYMPPDVLPNRSDLFRNEAWEYYFKVDEVRLQGDTVLKNKPLPLP